MSLPRGSAGDIDGDLPIDDTELPLDPDALTQFLGLDRVDAAAFAHAALEKVGELIEGNQGQPLSAVQIAEAITSLATAEAVREGDEGEDAEESKMSQLTGHAGNKAIPNPLMSLQQTHDVVLVEETIDGLRRKRLRFCQSARDAYFAGQDPYALEHRMESLQLTPPGRDLISNMCQNVELAVELGKHLAAEDILSLYRANRSFYCAINSYLMSSVRSWIDHHCPEAARVFDYKLYKRHLTPDPVGRTWADQGRPVADASPSQLNTVRTVPGLKYLQLVMGRSRCCSEMLAVMARNGHRTPPSMHATLLRLWQLMELSTSSSREALLRNQALWSDQDLYNAQLLFVKLGLHFNDPIYGPSTYDLLHLILGQRGLFPLWQLLTRRRFTTASELVDLRVRYDLQLAPDSWAQLYVNRTLHGVPFDEVGVGHLEGWGLGERHLMRPDELVPLEAVARGLELDQHLIPMMVWGYFDWRTGANIVPSREEMHVADERRVFGDADTSHHWREKHVNKARFSELSAEEQNEIIEDDEDQRLRAMAWCGDDDDGEGSGEEEEEEEEAEEGLYTLDDEIERGFIVPHQEKDHVSQVPGLGDRDGWREFVNEAILGTVPDIGEEEKLRTQPWNNYQNIELQGEWDWGEWLRQHQVLSAAMGLPADDTSLDEDDEGDEDEDEDEEGEDGDEGYWDMDEGGEDDGDGEDTDEGDEDEDEVEDDEGDD